MADYMFVKDAAVLWNISERQVSGLCTRGRIPGAVKQGRSWMIPTTAEKPADQRIKSGAYIRTTRTAKLPLPIGISDYRLASSNYYYIDKTMMIKDFIDDRPIVSLFTRPRRFGKTLNMDMLRVFFEKTDDDTSVYFKDKKIWACGERYRAYQGKYPVIYVTFKDVKCEDWESTYALIFQILRNEVQRHSELLGSDRISSYDKKYLESILDGTASEIDVAMLFMNLSRMLDAHHGRAPIIIIDEYDAPVQQGHARGNYEKVIAFMRNLFSGGLKDNRHLSFGFLTGVQYAAENSLLSGVNNLSVNSSIVFIDEGNAFVSSRDFANAICGTSNYYVLITRESLYQLPYSVEAVLELRKTTIRSSGNTRCTYNKAYPYYKTVPKVREQIPSFDKIITEDSNAGHQMFSHIAQLHNIKCESAGGKSNVFQKINTQDSNRVLVVADGAAFGADMEKVYQFLSEYPGHVTLFLPESFEWLILKAGVVRSSTVERILTAPQEYIDSEKYFSWEQYFTELLIELTHDQEYMRYNKAKLVPFYLQPENVRKLLTAIELD